MESHIILSLISPYFADRPDSSLERYVHPRKQTLQRVFPLDRNFRCRPLIQLAMKIQCEAPRDCNDVESWLYSEQESVVNAIMSCFPKAKAHDANLNRIRAHRIEMQSHVNTCILTSYVDK